MENDQVMQIVQCAGLGLIAGLVIEAGKRLLKRRGRQSQIDQLDWPLFKWSQADDFRIRDLLTNVLVLGRTGSGKSSGSGRFMLRNIVANRNSGGLLLCGKPEDCDDARKVFDSVDRSDDLLVIHPDSELRCNFLDYVRRLGGDTREITRAICTIAESLRQSDTKGGEDRDYWEQQQERMIYNAVEVVKLATGTVSAPELQAFIASAATSPAQLQSEEWKAKRHNQLVAAAFKTNKNSIAQHDFDLAREYWFNEFPNLASRTRSSIQVGVMQVLHVMCSGLVREMVSRDTNVSPDDILAGRWIVVNMPPSKYGDSGAFINAGWKYLTQKAVLRRKAEVTDRFVVIWCDEAQQFVNSHDSHYMAQCRSHLGCQVFLTQSLHSLFSALSGETGKQQALALLTNFGHRIFHALGSADTDAAYASGLIGKSLQTFISGSMPSRSDLFAELLGTSEYTAGFSEHYESIVQPNEFLHGLRCGGRESGFLVDSIVVKSGERFKNGQNWMRVTFSQRN